MMMNSDMDVVNNLSELESLNPSVQDLLSLSSTHVGFSDHNQIPFSFTNDTSNNPNAAEDFGSLLAHFFPLGGGPTSHGCSNINSLSEPNCLANSCCRVSGTSGLLVNNKANGTCNYGGKKRKRNHEREMEKPREVVHVRAKRGQATDSHSLAERLRRERINDKLRCLQDLVPGCYKTMGMAVMLDVIINYVRSLQNQIDFLSMKLSAASLFYDFNSSDMDVMSTMQGTDTYEAQGQEKMVGEGSYVLPHYHTYWPV
ncbi:hypothetical protein ACH5RR_030164 [Cinchona calisaya]|uniref:BHLH domain-containing protein n=1 Tax=Cinchona calisaya TaxID=153742 RepID=A0ABD2YTW4_9GENT